MILKYYIFEMFSFISVFVLYSFEVLILGIQNVMHDSL